MPRLCSPDSKSPVTDRFEQRFRGKKTKARTEEKIVSKRILAAIAVIVCATLWSYGQGWAGCGSGNARYWNAQGQPISPPPGDLTHPSHEQTQTPSTKLVVVACMGADLAVTRTDYQLPRY